MSAAKRIIFTSAAHGDHSLTSVRDTLIEVRANITFIAALGDIIGTEGFDPFAEMPEDRQMAIFNNIARLADRAIDSLLRLDDMLSMADAKESEADHE